MKWRVPLLLFGLTVASIVYTAALAVGDPDQPIRLVNGASFAVSLLAILLTHEFAHYAFARYHRVNASLPHFIPLPVLSPFGTMGAVIFMRDRIKSRNALVDIGASGPIAGLVVAIPVLLFGLAHSEVHPLLAHGQQEGQSLLYWLAKRVALGPIPAGSDVYLSPVAEAGWVGLFITMLNLLPVGQLDGGHVAYALLGPRQNRYSKFVRLAMFGLFALNFGFRLWPARHALTSDALLVAVSASTPWLTWAIVLSLLDRFSGGGHPPTEPGTLSPLRKVVAISTLILFVLLFMPTPWMTY